MKSRIIKASSLVIALVLLTMAFASCSTISGTYEYELAGTGASYEFSGSKVTITAKVLGAEVGSFDGKYSIKDDKITFTFEDEEAEEYSGTFDFEKGDDYIKIGLIEYKKK